MNRLVLILTFILPLLLYGQGDLSEKVDDQLRPIRLPKKSWSDTTLGWSTLFQYHQKKKASKYLQCSGANFLYEYIVTENKNKTLQLDRVIYLDSNGMCYSNIDSVVQAIPKLTRKLNYSIVFDTSFNILQIKYRSPIVLKSQELLLEAYENYVWEEMQYGKWLLEVRDSMSNQGSLPIQKFELSPKQKKYNDSIMELLNSIPEEPNSAFYMSHRSEVDSCQSLYKSNKIAALKTCLNCYEELLLKCGYEGKKLWFIGDLEVEIGKLTNLFNVLIARADQAYGQGKFEEALKWYKQAKEINEENQYPITQIEKIKQLTNPKQH